MDVNGNKRKERYSSNFNESMGDCSGCDDHSGDVNSNQDICRNKRKIHDISSTGFPRSLDHGSKSTSVHDNDASSLNASSKKDETVSLEAAKILTKLDLVATSELNKQSWFKPLCQLLAGVIKINPHGFASSRLQRLKRHIHCRENGKLSVNLVAASYLKIHPDIHEVQCPQSDKFPKYLPSPIRQKLFHGRFVPIRHIIYGEALTLGIACYKVNDRKVPSEPYPLNLKLDSPPQVFVRDIQRPDIIRALTTHSITISFRFPRLAARMHHLIRHMWILLYQENMAVPTAMDVYDAYFLEFENYLDSLTVMPMNDFPSSLIEKVLKNSQSVSDVR